ncbi:MAG: hypothetical protein BroJett030_32480 [Alphaproteobacteria bacterium]|nr:MAG: hypothetical protein BroJett030_32480 [Alphaproteobacteria bacterium]
MAAAMPAPSTAVQKALRPASPGDRARRRRSASRRAGPAAACGRIGSAAVPAVSLMIGRPSAAGTAPLPQA